jgi:hypothetical protein
VAFTSHAGGQAPAPAPPKEYDVILRYRIVGGRNERLAGYLAMTRYLKSIGYVPNPDQEIDPRDVNETRLMGSMPSTVDRKLLFLEPHIEAVLLMPGGYKLPDDLATPVKVQLELASGLPPDRQRVFADQVRAKVRRLGFQEAIGYDHRGHTRLLGLIRSGEVETLLRDLRWQPSGWLAPEERMAEVAPPLRNASPIRVIEVLPEPEGASPRGWGAVAERVTVDATQKLSPELRARPREGDTARERYEVFLTYAPGPDDAVWREVLQRAAPELVIEGRLGTMVTAVASPKDLLPLAGLPIVSGIRLPRAATPSPRPVGDTKGDNAEVLRAAGVSNLHALGHRGRGVRAAVVGGDFRGWERYRGKELPAETRYVDLTAERNPTIEPDPFPGEASGDGAGTQAALALALAAPESELTIIRIDPAAPHQLDAVVRLLRCEPFLSESLLQRRADLRADAEELRLRRQELNEERRRVLSDFRQTDEAVQRREAHFRKAAQQEKDERAWQGRQNRYFDILEAQRALGGIQVVASSLVWDSGYPASGDSPLTRLFSDDPPCRFWWFQSAGNTRGQTWAGMFRDTDGNGVMEYAAAEAGLVPGRWTRELNFLGWQPHDKEVGPDLPDKLRVRLSVQWREAHDPSLFQPSADLYRAPLADLRVVVLRQRDPSGRQVGADEFDVVGQSTGLAQRIDNGPSSATYEHVVEFTADPTGRYAVRVEGRTPGGVRPSTVASLPAQYEGWEMWPRVHVEALDAESRRAGRPVFLDYPTDVGSLGIPADAQGAYTVGAVNLAGEARPYSSKGPALGRELLLKPNVWSYDGMALGAVGDWALYGSDIAAPFAAGTTAAALSSGISPAQWQRHLHTLCGQVLRVP